MVVMRPLLLVGRVILIMIIWIMLTASTFGAVAFPWVRNLAAPGILLLRPDDWQAAGGALVHELCHIQQFRDGRAREDITILELECSCAEYLYYERIGYQPGMTKVIHYKIP